MKLHKFNLVTDLNDATVCFEQSINIATPHELRCLFATLTVNGFPTLAIWYNENHKHQLLLDCLDNGLASLPMRTAENNFLRELQQRLALEDKTLETYGFPTPRGNTTEIERERELYDPHEQNELYHQLSAEIPNNLD